MCFDPKEFAYATNLWTESARENCFGSTDAPASNVTGVPASESWCPLDNISEAMIGKYCLVKYDERPFPGEIINVDIETQECYVKCMCKIGNNRFFWPNYPDVAWYEHESILSLIPEPVLIGRNGRHYEICADIWEKAQNSLDV